MVTIPYARGLREELSTRVQNLIVAAPTEQMAPDGIHKLTRYDLFDGEKKLGTVEVNSFEQQGTWQIENVTYNGIMPGYLHEEIIGLTATSVPTLEPSDSDYLRADLYGNNTGSKPLYRHDGHDLRLADHEINGNQRRVFPGGYISKDY